MDNIRMRMPEPIRINPHIIYKHRLLDFLAEVQKSHGMIYKTLCRLPKSVLRIIVDDDYRDTLEVLTIEEFLASLHDFHPRLTFFSVRFNTYLFRKEWVACGAKCNEEEIYCGVEFSNCCTPDELHEIVDAFECILAYYLRELMKECRPFRVDDRIRREYGLTDAEGEELRELVDHCNATLQDEFRDDLHQLQLIVGTFDGCA